MSIQAIKWCVKQKHVAPGEWVVLFHLAHHHNAETGRCDPSQDYLSEAIGMTSRQIRRHLSSLETRGLLRRQKRGVLGGGRRSDFYVFAFDPAFSEGSNRKSDPHEPDISGHPRTGHLRSTKRTFEVENVPEMSAKQEEQEEQEIPPIIPPWDSSVTETDPNRTASTLPLYLDGGASAQKGKEPDVAPPALLKPAKNSLSDQIDQAFDIWWSEIWPSHPRKASKADCRARYRQIVEGKYAKVDRPISAEDLNQATAAYIESVRDPQYIKGTKAWLNDCGWEPFVGGKVYPMSQPQRRPGQRASDETLAMAAVESLQRGEKWG